MTCLERLRKFYAFDLPSQPGSEDIKNIYVDHTRIRKTFSSLTEISVFFFYLYNN